MLRPKSLKDVIGQDHILSDGKIIHSIITNNTLTSLILFGPPGTGKTTLAEIIANSCGLPFFKLNATSATVKEIRKIGEAAITNGQKALIFVDEVHRFSSTQQDVLLPYVEEGHLVFVGATVSNPFHAVNGALISRAHIVELHPLTAKESLKVVGKGLNYYRSLGKELTISGDAAKHIINVSCGDARKILTIIQLVVELIGNGEITLEHAEVVAPSKYYRFNYDGTEHFDLASAYQGSIQASDANSAIYWLAKWLESGEDPRYIARRLMVSASEDAAGNPECIAAAHAAYTAACEIGRPECDIILAHATILTATAPRNKTAAMAIWAAVADVKKGYDVEVPLEMKDSHYPGAKQLGHGDYHDGSNPIRYVGVKKHYLHGLTRS